MRLFLAFDIDENFRRECDFLIMKGKKLFPKEIKWVESQNLHFTFAFLGDVEQNDVKIVIDLLSDLSKDISLMDMNNGVLKWNPPFKPQTIWIEYLLENQELVEKRKDFLKKIKIELPYLKLDNKDFKLHLTLGRIKNKINIEKWLLHEEVFNSSTSLKHISLYESILYPQGPVYKNLALYNLQGGNLV